MQAYRMAAALLFVGAAAVACGRPTPPPVPTDELRPVTSEAAPLLGEIEDDEGAQQVLHTGELVAPTRMLPALKWHGSMDGAKGGREGAMIEVRRAPGDGLLFGFESDLGPAVAVPAASFICGELARAKQVDDAGACTKGLFRFQTADGAIAAYTLCPSGTCPVAIVRDGAVRSVSLAGATMARVARVGGRSVLFVSARFVRAEGTWTGGALVPIVLAGAEPRKLAEIPTDEVDARDPAKVVTRIVDVHFGDRDVRVAGQRRETTRDGKELASAPIDETRPIAP